MTRGGLIARGIGLQWRSQRVPFLHADGGRPGGGVVVLCLCALLAVAVHPCTSEAQVTPAPVTDIRVGRDTVSFYARVGEYGGTERRVARFARQSGAWLAGDGFERQVPNHVPQSTRDRMRLAPRLQLAGRQHMTGQEWFRNYSIVDTRTGRTYPLRPSLSVVERWRATLARDSVGHGEYALWWDDPPTPCERVDRWTVDPHAVWFVCSGGGDALGVLMRFDRSTHQTATMSGAELASTEVVDFVETRRALWTAGQKDLAASLGDAGLFRFDLGTRTWSRVTADSAGGPPGLLTALAASGDSLWVGTDDGVALYDESRSRWEGRRFHAELVTDTSENGDNIVLDHRFSMAARQSIADEARNRLAIEIAERLMSGRSYDPADSSARSLDSAIRAVPPAHFDSALAAPHNVLAHALAHPALIAVATAGWLGPDSSDVDLDADVLRAIGLIGDRRFLPFLRHAWQPQGLESGELFALASTLARFRDTAAVRWLHDMATKSVNWYEIEPAVDVLVEVGDTAVGPAIAARMNEPGSDQQDGPALLLWAFARVATPAQWRAAIPSLVASGRLRLALFDRFYRRRVVDSMVRSEPVSRAAALAIARHELATRADTSTTGDRRIDHWAAADIAVLLGDRGAVPYLIPLLTQSPPDYRAASTALIRLTGVDSAPPWLAPTPTQRTAVQRFWSDWWAAQGPVPVSSATDDKAALRRWRLRALGL